MVTVKSLFCGEELVLETGLLAKQAHGAVTLRLGNTTILAEYWAVFLMACL